eukprot:CAMPEP_0181304866 /NCGR_PEP_ID=MMETSP1101-20121128/9398_1 /TAXON_ID=46948 /ORGANISM="Rhodomonas abbreviata, Strain Caron Lab Isolate" /LENGTH=486 /DNA_ID=CAMNT_0023410691 /DNA_START=277 /DNA_END=1737 /DNA_ORIENTATION=+
MMRIPSACALVAMLMVSTICAAPIGFTRPNFAKHEGRGAENDENDLITNLPGMPAAAKFQQYAGYVDIGGGKSIFYWLVESERKPATDPLVLWTNGGPGCSGLSGFLGEQGPFRANAEGGLDMNPHAWNKLANMVFIEQPAGVGFSKAPEGMKYGDEEAATDNYNFVIGFLKKFPQFGKNDFYITSESYGGHYLPTLAVKLAENNMPTFKGMMVGNPLTWMPYRNYGQYATFAAHQLVPKPVFDKYAKAGCDLENDANETLCVQVSQIMDELTQDLDPYALDFPVCTDAVKGQGQPERLALMRKVAESRRMEQEKRMGEEGRLNDKETGGLGGYFPKYKPCIDSYLTSYLNRKDVQAAIHVRAPGSVEWGVCNDMINAHYDISDVNAPMMPLYRKLIAHGGIKILVYSGDDDSVCATAGAQMWIWDFGPPKDAWKPWFVSGQVGGYSVELDGLHFATVHGAGHMVPATRPAQALHLFRAFLEHEKL